MAYVQPQNNLHAQWEADGGALFLFRYQGRDYERRVRPNEIVTIVEVAALLKVSRSTPHYWITRKANRLKASKAKLTKGREVYVVRLSDLTAFAHRNGLLGPWAN